MKRNMLSAAIPEDLAKRLDRVSDRCIKTMSTNNKSTVIRWALSIGLDMIERDLDVLAKETGAAI